MPDQPLSGRPKGQPRLDLHNSNVEQVAAEHDQCGTIDLRTGRVCRRAALHSAGCDFAPADALDNTDKPTGEAN
jgi:hypothetical protein